MSLSTLNREDVKITIAEDGAVFVNSARVINADVLIENGVLHVIDEVLNPVEPDAEPDNSTATSPTLATAVPFTSGVLPETSIFNALTGTTSFIAAGLVTASASASSGVVQQTANAGVQNVIPVMAAAVVGAVGIAVGV